MYVEPCYTLVSGELHRLVGGCLIEQVALRIVLPATDLDDARAHTFASDLVIGN